MSKVISIYKCHEIIVDANNDFVSKHITDLPHSEFIQQEFCKQFNEAVESYLLDIINKECDDKIQRLIAKPMTAKSSDHKTAVGVHIYGKSNVRFTEKFRTKVFDFIDSQFADGWGESFFGPINTMTAPDGTRLYID